MYITSADTKIRQKRYGAVICPDCGRVIAVTEKGAEYLSLAITCKCGSMYYAGKKNLGTTKKDSHVCHTAEGYICPKCSRRIIKIKAENIRNAVFVIKCDCGAVYYSKDKRRLRRARNLAASE